MKTFQICYDGDLTLEFASALRRLGGEPNFDKSWRVELPRHRSAALLIRHLRRFVAPDGQLIVAATNPTRGRDLILIRHSITHGFDYAPLHAAIRALGEPLELPAPSTWLVRASSSAELAAIGSELEPLCPYDALMVIGIGTDFSVWTAADGHFFASEEWLIQHSQSRQ